MAEGASADNSSAHGKIPVGVLVLSGDISHDFRSMRRASGKTHFGTGRVSRPFTLQSGRKTNKPANGERVRTIIVRTSELKPLPLFKPDDSGADLLTRLCELSQQ